MILKLGDDFGGDGFDVADSFLAGAGYAEDDVAGAGVDVFAQSLDAHFGSAEEAVVAHDVEEIAAVEIAAAEGFGGGFGGFLLGGVDGDIGEEGPLESGEVAVFGDGQFGYPGDAVPGSVPGCRK